MRRPAAAAQANLHRFEEQLQHDLAACLGTDLARVEMVGSEPRKQVVEADGAAFAPIVTHVNLLLPSEAAAGDKRPVQVAAPLWQRSAPAGSDAPRVWPAPSGVANRSRIGVVGGGCGGGVVDWWAGGVV